MTEYIDREAAIAIIEEKQKELCPVGRYGRGCVYGTDREKFDAWDEIINDLENIPAADVAPVTRCKDCDAWKRNVGIVDSPNGHCFEHDIDTNGQDFCSYGARKENENG